MYEPIEVGSRSRRTFSAAGRIVGALKLDGPLLVGLGLRRLSMSPRMVPAIKTRLRELDCAELEVLARRAGDFATAPEVEAFVRSALAAGPVERPTSLRE